MRFRTALLALTLLTACGEAAPEQVVEPVVDDTAIVVAPETTNPSTPPPPHEVDTTRRNPFERP